MTTFPSKFLHLCNHSISKYSLRLIEEGFLVSSHERKEEEEKKIDPNREIKRDSTMQL